MDRESEELSSIIAVEVGAGWPSWLSDYQRSAPNSVVIAEPAGATVKDFSDRVLHRVEEMLAAAQVLRVAALVCNLELDPERINARRRICERLVAALTLPGAELVLAANGADEVSKQALFALAGDLCETGKSPSCTVRVRFASDHATSGTRPSVPALTVDGIESLRASR